MNFNRKKLTEAVRTMEEAALKAGCVLVKMQAKSQRLTSPKDFLLDADLKSETIILRILASSYPKIPALSEEKGGKKGGWVIDPLDGSINFFLMDDHWGVSIALTENGKTVAAVIYLPARRELFSATRITPTRCRILGNSKKSVARQRVSREEILSRSQCWIGWGKEEHGGDDHKKVCEIIRRLDSHTLYPQIRNSATADMMRVAQGKIAGYVFPKPEPFDIAAAGLIVEQAGGKVTDMEGNPWTPFSPSLIASNGHLHADLLRILK